MFRKLKRIKQKLTDRECKDLLINEKRGVLSVMGEGYPYALPINHYYDEDKNAIYFHSGKTGYKVDCIEKNDKACFCVYDKGYKNDGEWWLNVKSVIVFGKIEKITDLLEIEDISRKLSYKFTLDKEYIQNEIDKYAKNTLCLKLSIENMCGKVVCEK